MTIRLNVRIGERCKFNFSAGQWLALHVARGYLFAKFRRWEFERITGDGT